MKILVDGDSCPVLDIIINFARDNDLSLLVFFDINHEPALDYGTSVLVDLENQEINQEILSRIETQDLVITQDYGLASQVLDRGAYAVNQQGLIYTAVNLKRLLSQRKARDRKRRAESGNNDKPLTRQRKKERTWQDDVKFYRALKEVSQEAVTTKSQGGNK